MGETIDDAPHPADFLELRSEIATLFNEIVYRFESFNTDERQQIIDLLALNEALMYFAVLDADYNSLEGFRKHMILST